MDSTDNGWVEWFQNVAGNVITQATAAKYQQPFQLQQAQMQYRAQQPQGIAAGGSSLLLIGGVVLLAVLLLKD